MAKRGLNAPSDRVGPQLAATLATQAVARFSQGHQRPIGMALQVRRPGKTAHLASRLTGQLDETLSVPTARAARSPPRGVPQGG